MSYSIKDKTVLITGANRGIGKAFVDSFMEHGAARIYAAVRTVDSAFPLVEQYEDKIIPIHLDLTDTDSISAAARIAKDVQVVVNNAGVLTKTNPLDEDAISALEFEMNTNVYGLIRMARAFSPVLEANSGSVFVQINSVGSVKYFSPVATYCASKAAAYSITQALWELLGTQGTIVLSVHPGPFATDMADMLGVTKIAEPPSLVPEAVMEALQSGAFHVFPGLYASQLGEAYKEFAASQSIPDVRG